jgi:SPOR domain
VKALVVFLLVANGLAFAWWNGMLSQWLGDGREPERIQTQVAATKAKLVPVAKLIAPPPASAFVLCVDYPAAPEPKATELENLVRALITAKPAALKLDKEQSTEGGNYLVYLAISPTLKEAQRKLFELKRVGIDDVALISEGDLKWAISLGVYGTEEASKNRMQQLARVGIPGVKVAARSAVVNRVALKVKVSDVELKAPLYALSSATLGAEAKACPL